MSFNVINGIWKTESLATRLERSSFFAAGKAMAKK